MKTTSILSVFLSAAVALGDLVIPAANVYAESEEKRIEIDTDNVTGGEGYKGSSYLNAVDGDLGTFFDGLTGQYVQIDMGSTYDKMCIRDRYMCAARRRKTTSGAASSPKTTRIICLFCAQPAKEVS